MINIGTITEVVSGKLCTGCGTCAGLCPQNAIEMKINRHYGIYLPHIDPAGCNRCGVCLLSCPGIGVDHNKLNQQIFGKLPDNLMLGQNMRCYIGYANNADIRYHSSSGGIITSLLILALEKGLINGALVTRMSKASPMEPETFIARTPEEIREASKSKYCPVPANIALREILQANHEERFAVVGLPCHIQGIRKAMAVNQELRKRIALCFGLVCGHEVSFLGTQFLLKNKGLKIPDIQKLEYRDEGWPGFMKISMKGGKTHSISHVDYWVNSGFNSFFYPLRCLSCIDTTSELADISLGGAWLAEYKEQKVGHSTIITRSQSGEKILRLAAAEGRIQLIESSAANVMRSHGKLIRHNKVESNAYLKIKRLLGRPIPNYSAQLLKPEVKDYLSSIARYSRVRISTQRYLWKLIKAYISSKSWVLDTGSMLKRIILRRR